MHKSIRLSTILLFSISCIVLLSAGCRKTEEPDSYDIWLPERLKEIFLVQPGSYWIMEEIGLNRDYRDSVYVTETILDTVVILHPGSGETFGLKERFRVKYYSLFYGREFHIVTESADICPGVNQFEPCHFLVIENHRDGGLLNKSRFYYYPDEPDNGWNIVNSGLYEPQFRIAEIIPAYSLKGQVFDQVRKVETERDRTHQNARIIRHIAPAAGGIIQWEQPEINVNWITVDYHLVR
jgi:hypothetical protein